MAQSSSTQRRAASARCVASIKTALSGEDNDCCLVGTYKWIVITSEIGTFFGGTKSNQNDTCILLPSMHKRRKNNTVRSCQQP